MQLGPFNENKPANTIGGVYVIQLIALCISILLGQFHPKCLWEKIR